MSRVVVTGIGMVSPLAANVNDTWDQLIHSKSGINKITSFETNDLSVKIAGQIPTNEEKFGFEPNSFETKVFIISIFTQICFGRLTFLRENVNLPKKFDKNLFLNLPKTQIPVTKVFVVCHVKN